MFERLRLAGWSIQAHFLLYSLALLVPALIFAGLMTLRSASLERVAVEASIGQVAHDAATAIDRELSATTTTLVALASSPALTDGEMKTFYGQAVAAKGISGSDFFLTSRTGKLLITTQAPWDQQGEARGSPVVDAKAVLQAAAPVVSDVASTEGNSAPGFSISVAVRRGTRAIYALSALIPARHIQSIIERTELEPGWTAAVIDRGGAIVARSQEHDQRARPGMPWDGNLSDVQGPKGELWRTSTRAGVPVLRYVTKSQLSGWLIAITVPEAIANRPIERSWALVVMLALCFGLLSALLAFLFGRRLADPVGALVQDARRLGRGDIVTARNSSIIEVRTLGEELAAASETRQTMEKSLRISEDRLRLALASSETGAWDWDLTSGALTWDSRMRELWGLSVDDAVSFEVFNECLNPADRAMVAEAVRRARDPAGDAEYNVEYRVKGARNGVERWIAATGRTQFADGAAVRMAGTARDITDRKMWEEHTQLLIREVTHRSKNLLAVIQAMARQTKLASRDVNDFELRFSGRLQALAAAHDLLVQRDWRGASMAEVVRSQLGHYLDQQAGQIEFEGPSLIVTPEAAQNIGLAVHELSTNAAKYGALSVPEGQVKVRWVQNGNGGDDRRIVLSWTEMGGPEVVPPVRRGFGQVVTEQLTARALHGKASLMFEPTGVLWTLDMPAQSVLAS